MADRRQAWRPPCRRGRFLPLAVLPFLLAAWAAQAQQRPGRRAASPSDEPAPALQVTADDRDTPFSAEEGILLAADLDDEDEDGRLDAFQARPPTAGLRQFQVHAPDASAVLVRVKGPAQIFFRGRPVGRALGYRFGPDEARVLRFALQGLDPRHGASGSLRIAAGRRRLELPLTVVRVRLLRGAHRPLDPRRDALGVSHRVTHDASLPRDTSWDTVSPDPENLRVEVFDPRRPEEASVVLRSLPAGASEPPAPRAVLEGLPLVGDPGGGTGARAPWVRLVGDAVDAEAPGVSRQVLRVALRDVVEVVYRAPGGPVRQRWRVGRPGHEDGPRAARRARLRIHVLRLTPGGPPVLGDGSEQSALRLARHQVAVASEVWLQCFLDFGPPERTEVRVVDPPPPALLAISDGLGLPAAGGGLVRFRAGGRPVGPIETRPGELPVQLAARIAEALGRLGFRPRVTELPTTDGSNQHAADLYVRDARGRPVTLSAWGQWPLSTDARQRVQIGRVDLTDGLQQFDNANNAGGTLEERALLYGVIDDDPRTLDVVVVDRFTGGSRLGEAFIEMRGGPIVDAVVLDRNGVRTERAAWTLAHELGHVLLDHPLHPDQVGPDRPWLLMDADVSRAHVAGPKRLLPEECARFRARSGLRAVPPLVDRHPD